MRASCLSPYSNPVATFLQCEGRAESVAAHGMGRKLLSDNALEQRWERGRVPRRKRKCRSFRQGAGTSDRCVRSWGSARWSVSAQADEVPKAAPELLGRQPNLQAELLQLARIVEVAPLQS